MMLNPARMLRFKSHADLPAPRYFVVLTLFFRVFIFREEEDELVFEGLALWNWETARLPKRQKEASQWEWQRTLKSNDLERSAFFRARDDGSGP